MFFQFEEEHTGPALAHELRRILEKFGLDGKVHAIINDNAANIVNAVKLLKLLDWGCSGHTFQLIVNDSIKENQTVQDVVSRVTDIVTSIRRSDAKKRLFDQCQKRVIEQDEHTLQLIGDVATRWNSTYDLLRRFLQLRETLELFFFKEGILFSQDDWDVIKDLIEDLKPFSDATTKVSAEKKVTVSEIIPQICYLENIYDSEPEDISRTSSIFRKYRVLYVSIHLWI